VAPNGASKRIHTGLDGQWVSGGHPPGGASTLVEVEHDPVIGAAGAVKGNPLRFSGRTDQNCGVVGERLRDLVGRIDGRHYSVATARV
jgi:hypothetical protein